MDILNLGDAPDDYEVQEDGSMLIPDLEDSQETSGAVFDINLAEVLGSSDLSGISNELVELVEKDKESRRKRDEQYQDGLRRTGLGDDAPGGAEFNGASKVVHPVLAEACVDFSARAIKELFPAQGPVKTSVIGANTPDKLARADRKMRFMNWQLTTQIEEYRVELEQTLTQLPMGGSGFIKFWYDEELHRPACAFVGVDEIFLPFAASGFYSSARATHRQLITRSEFAARVKSGLYRDVFLTSPGSTPETSLTGEANDKIEGREDDGYNEDGLRAILEIYVKYAIDGDELTGGDPAPYIITIDEDTEQVLSVYRNWEQTDPLRKRLDWFVEFKFIPWRGAYGIGLPHLIGGLSAALTGALRALLDSAHINNAATMLKLKAGRVVGQSTSVDVTQVCEIEGPTGIDDIRKIAMPMPFNQPSPVLANLLGSLYTLAKGVVSTADDQLAKVGDRTPVGTTMSMIEQGSVIYSAVHARLHESQKRVLAIVQRIDRMSLAEQDLSGIGDMPIEQNDFLATMDVIPVSDPTIFSEAQRFAQTQSMIQMSADQSVQWNKVEVYRRALRQMRIDDIDTLLPAPPKPVTADFAAENMAALQQGMQLKADVQQDHQAHIQGHLAAVMAPWVLSNEFVPPQAVNAVLQHVNQHIQMLVSNAVSMSAQQIIQSEAAQGRQIQPERALIAAQQQVAPAMQQFLAPPMQQMQQIGAKLKERTPPPQLPPDVQASIEIAKMEIQRKTAADQVGVQLEQAKLQAKQQFDSMKLQTSQMEQQFNQQMQQAREAFTQHIKQASLQMQGAKQQSELELAQRALLQEREIAELKQHVELLKNAADNLQKSSTEIQKNDADNATSIEINESRNDAAMERTLVQELGKLDEGNS